MRTHIKRLIAPLLIFALTLSIVGVAPSKAKKTTISLPYDMLNRSVRTDLEDFEIVTLDNINITTDTDYDPRSTDDINYESSYLEIKYLEDASDFDQSTAGTYRTYYEVKPKSGKEPYVVSRTVKVTKEYDSDELIGDERTADEFPLAIGEIENMQVVNAGFSISLDESIVGTQKDEEDTSEKKSILANALNMIFPAKLAKAASDTLKVGYSGHVAYCGRRMGYKYITSDGDYKNALVYCLNLSKNTTNGTVEAGSGNISVKILYCLVNGARKKGGLCYKDKYSSGTAEKDYFITGAAIHVLNGEVKLSYYNDGSGVYKNIKQMVDDANNLNKSDYNTSKKCTNSITYSVSPTKSKWTMVSDGLYRSEEKFVRTKTGTIQSIAYSISGAPSGLTTGEIAKDSSDISDSEDLKKYDICVAQTNSDAASSNFYVYANQEAMDKIIAENSTIKVTAKAKSAESRGRTWSPSIVSQQKVTFMEKNWPVVSATASVKITSAEIPQGSLIIKKTDTYTNDAVSGAVYGLYEDSDCDELLCELTKYSDPEDPSSDGLYASGIQGLTQKKYYLKEISSPTGYAIDEEVHEVDYSYFTILDASGATIQEGRVLDVNDAPEKSSVMVIKKDGETGKTVKNAKFAVFDDEACTKRTLIEPSQSTTQVPIFSYDDDLDAYVSDMFTRTQESYYIKEVTVPKGYVDFGYAYKVNPDIGEMVTIDVENIAIKCDITLHKEDKELRLAQGDAKLSGAVYGLYAGEDIYHPDGEDMMRGSEIKADKGTDLKTYDVTAIKDTLLATLKTDDTGTLKFKDLYYGKYYIKEITPSEGYLLDTTSYDIDFTAKPSTSKTISLEVTSKEQVMKQPFDIIKVSTDGKTGETKKVEGAKFTVKLKSEVTRLTWDKAGVYDELTTDKKGYALSKELPYGTYIVRETYTPPNLDSVPDFEVRVDHDERTPQEWRVLNDAPFKAYVRIIKKDKETGKIVLLKDTTFKIRKIGESDFIRQKLGDKYIDEFITDDTGTITTPLKLEYGDYELTEIKAPTGYLINSKPVQFKISSNGAVMVNRDKDGDAVIDVYMENEPVKGKIVINKKGEVLKGATYDTIIDRILDFVTGDNRSVTFTYEMAPLAGAVFNIIADEDIYTSDYQVDDKGNRIIATYDGKPVKKGEIIATVTTNDKGEASVDNLPLGKYHLEETFTPKGFIAPSDIKPIELSYKDDKTAVIESVSEIENIRQKADVSIIKTEGAVTSVSPASTDAPSVVVTGQAVTVNEDTVGKPVEGAVYGIFSTIDIKDISGNILVQANTLIESGKTDENGEIHFDCDLPLGKYYIKEITPAHGYLLDESEYELDFTNPEKGVEITKKEYLLEDRPIIVQISKTDITESLELPDAVLQVIDKNNEVFEEWTTDGTPKYISGIPAGDYTLKEISAPYGYYITTEAKFSVKEDSTIDKVVMIDERATGYIKITKTDRDSGDAIEGVEFSLLDPEGVEIEKLITDKDGIATSDLLEIGSYKPNGEFDKAYTYQVKETKAAKGYKNPSATLNIKFEYEKDISEPIEKRLSVTNEASAKKLPQTGGTPYPIIFILGGIGITAGIIWYRKKRKIGG